jgi:precorrin-6B methylase 2
MQGMTNPEKNQAWTGERWLDLGRSYQTAAVFAAAADLEIFDVLRGPSRTAEAVARDLACPSRGVGVLLDALAALQLLVKRGQEYSLIPGSEDYLTTRGSRSIVRMAQHQANCLRNWAQLAQVVQSGRPAQRAPSVRGPVGDRAAFIGGMHNISAPIADRVIRGVQPLSFQRLLDVGGASGTWTMAFLRACPAGTAILFDLPEVIKIAKDRLAEAGLAPRVECVAGDFTRDPLPAGVDLAWVSAIVHQNSRSQNRALFRKVGQALVPGGRIVLRDILMQEDRVAPLAGALFAVNMLVATEGGGTFTFAELRGDLESAGLGQVKVASQDEGMNSLVIAQKP